MRVPAYRLRDRDWFPPQERQVLHLRLPRRQDQTLEHPRQKGYNEIIVNSLYFSEQKLFC